MSTIGSDPKLKHKCCWFVFTFYYPSIIQSLTEQRNKYISHFWKFFWLFTLIVSIILCIFPNIQKIIKVGFTYRLLYVGITEGKIAECRALKENIVKWKIMKVKAFFSLLSRPLDPFPWHFPNSTIKCIFLSLSSALSFPRTKTHRAPLDPKCPVHLACWDNSGIKTFVFWFSQTGRSALGKHSSTYTVLFLTVWEIHGSPWCSSPKSCK